MQNNQALPFNKENFKQIFSLQFITVIIISIPSSLVADYFNIPLAWFLGPMLITSLAALLGLKVKMPRLVLSAVLIVLGLYIGNYIDKSLFAQMHQWIWTSLIMLVYIIVSVLIVSKYLQIFSKYERKTSIFSAAPGALGPLMILAEDEKSDLSQVATSHLIRLIIIITIFPFIVDSFYEVENLKVVDEVLFKSFPNRIAYFSKNEAFYNQSILQENFKGLSGKVFPMEEGFCSYLKETKEGFVQGNFSPISLLKPHEDYLTDFNLFLTKMKGLSVSERSGWICSLSHGVLPKTPEINVRHFIQTIREQFEGEN